MQESKQESPQTSSDPGPERLAEQCVGKDVETETGKAHMLRVWMEVSLSKHVALTPGPKLWPCTAGQTHRRQQIQPK